MLPNPTSNSWVQVILLVSASHGTGIMASCYCNLAYKKNSFHILSTFILLVPTTDTKRNSSSKSNHIQMKEIWCWEICIWLRQEAGSGGKFRRILTLKISLEEQALPCCLHTSVKCEEKKYEELLAVLSQHSNSCFGKDLAVYKFYRYYGVYNWNALKSTRRGWGCSSVVGHVLCTCEVLDSVSALRKRRKH